MMRQLAAVLGVILVGVPFLVAPSWAIVVPGTLAAFLIAVGIIMLSAPLVAAGIAASLLEYTVALWLEPRAPDPITAVAFGSVLVLLLQLVDFARRFHGTTLGGAVITGQIRYWLVTGVLGVMVGLIVSGLAGGLALALPPAVYPVLALAGSLAALVAVGRLLLRRDGQ